MDRKAFRDMVIDEVTEYGSLPLKPKDGTVDKLIDTCKRYFYQNWSEANEEQYLIISKDMLKTALFKEKRQIKLPSCVRSVYELKETGSHFFYNEINPDFRKTNFNYTAYAVNADSDTMLTAVTYAYYMDFIRQFVTRTVAYNFNDKTGNLFITGRDNVFADLVARGMLDIPEDALFEADLFKRYVVGKLRSSIGRIFNITEFKMIGGNSLKFDDIVTTGKEEVKAVEQQIKDDNDDVAFFMVDDQLIG